MTMEWGLHEGGRIRAIDAREAKNFWVRARQGIPKILSSKVLSEVCSNPLG